MLTIALREALRDMNKKDTPFNCSFWSNDGQLIHIANCRIGGIKKGMNRKQYIGIQQHHTKRHPYTVHIRLLHKFNDLRIYW